MNKVLNSVIVGIILIVIGALFLVMGQAINSFNENQKVTEYKNSKRESLEHIDPYLNKLSDDDKYIAKFCYDYYKDKFNSATSITESPLAIISSTISKFLPLTSSPIYLCSIIGFLPSTILVKSLLL